MYYYIKIINNENNKNKNSLKDEVQNEFKLIQFINLLYFKLKNYSLEQTINFNKIKLKYCLFECLKYNENFR